MAYLLDTHTFLWMRHAPGRLGARARAVCADLDSELHLSVASVWEMAIKLSIGKLRLSEPLGAIVRDARTARGIAVLDVQVGHVLRVEQLPWHHRDPFDRLLVAQVLEEGLILLSADEAFAAYPIQRVW